MLLDVVTAVEIAISKLVPIEFEIEGLEGEVLPILGRIETKVSKYLYFRVYHEYGSPKIMADTTSHYYEFNYKKGHGGMIIPVECTSQSEIDEAIKKLWEDEEKVLSSPKNLAIHAWSQGNNLYEEIENLSSKKPFLISWKKFCEFSHTFTNGSNQEDFKESLLYMDNSGGFKFRGAFESEKKLAYYNSDEIVFNLDAANPKKEESIEHFFGEWEAYAYKPGLIFVFGSCNGNYLSGETMPGKKVKIRVDPNSNYAKFFRL